MPARRGPPISGLDLVLVAGLPVLAALAWALPVRRWPALCAALAPFQLRELVARPEAAAKAMARVLGGRIDEPHRVLSRLAAHNLAAQLHLLRGLARGAPPPVRLNGRERIDAALARGGGAVLWVGHFAYASLLAKVAWHQAGLAVSHLSHPRHGFSGSRFGMAVLNRLVRRVEDRYLGERVVMAADSPVAALRTLERRLGDNRVVSISARDTARRPLRVPFLDGEIALGGGAIDLARRTGAALLPAFAVRDEDGFVVAVEAPIGAEALARDEAARAYAAVLGRYVLRHPDQWLGWTRLSGLVDRS